MTSNKPRKYAHAGLDSDWSAKKILPAMLDKKIRQKFCLEIVLGIQHTVQELEDSMNTRIIQNGYSEEAKQSAREIIQKLKKGEIKYHYLNGEELLGEEIDTRGIDLGLVTTKNGCHLNGIKFFANREIPIICEKPAVPVLTASGDPTGQYLDELKVVVAQHPHLMMMDAEHYSQKQAALIFYQNLGKLLTGEDGKKNKIKVVHGKLFEKDNPYKPRTKNVLSKKNQTGLMADTGVHLLSFISNLGGIAHPFRREYACYSDSEVTYDVDTFDRVRYNIEDPHNKYFVPGAVAGITIAKFVDRAGESESKKLEFLLEDESLIEVDLAAGSVTKRTKSNLITFHVTSPIYDNEWCNIFTTADRCISSNTLPLTNFENSGHTLDSVLETYQLGGTELKDFYRR